MMQDDPDQFSDCAAVFKLGNKKSGVYSLTIPDTKQQFKVTSIYLIQVKVVKYKQNILYNNALTFKVVLANIRKKKKNLIYTPV